MTPELIQKVVGLVGKNGERIIVVDPQSGRAVVLLDLESYERLTAGANQPQVTPGPNAPAATVRVVPQPETVQKFVPIDLKKLAQQKEKEALLAAKQAATAPSGLGDLTQAELLDKINRDIGHWKTAQDAKRTEELKSAARKLQVFEGAQNLEEEERFFLEPIE